MQITIRGHHLAITPAIEENIKAKFNQLTKHLDQVNSMQIKLTKDHQIDKRSHKGSSNHVAEAIVRLLELSCLLKQQRMICILQ